MKILKTFLALIATLLCSTSLFAEDFEVDGIYYNITSEADKTVEITYRGDNYNSYANEYSGSVTIPESVTYNGTIYSVTSIGSRAFSGCSGLTSVTIPNSVTSIGYFAFSGCSGLTSIEIPSCVTEIGSGAFEGCSSLTSLTIPNSVKSIYCCTFNGCTGLKELIIEDSNEPLESLLDCKFHARHFDDYYFENSPIEHMYIGRDLNNYTFSYAKGDWRETLRTVEFGSKVTNVPNSMFDSCYKLSSVTIPESVTHIGNFAFYYCDSITNIMLPNSLRYIGANSFQGCNLKSITIPKSVTFIGRNAFNETMELEHIIVEGGNTMYDSRFNCNAIIESSTNTLKRGCMNTIIPYNVTKIDSCAFYACTELKNIEIPHSVVDIGVSAFSVCKGLETLVVPNSVVSIGDYAFKNCISLTSATIGDNVKDIGNYAFSSCGELEHIYCTALTPPTIGLKTFDKKDSKYPYTTFYVPRVSLDAYKSADVWKDLENYIFKPMVYMHLVSLKIDSIVIKSDSLEYGTDIILPEIEEKEGYTFVWDNIADKVPNHDFVIQGKYVPNNYAITYVLDGDTIATDSTAYGSAITLLEEPAKEGHTFLGWSEAPETMPANDVTITGSYKVNFYAVKYVVDGMDYATDSLTYGSAITLRDEPTKEGYTFMGWSEAPETMPANDITITGEYKVNTYTVMYVVDGEVIESYPVEYGEELVMMPLAPEKEGHTFMGWSELPATMPAEDVTVTGTFKVNTYAVTYVVDGVTVATDSVEYGTVVTLIDKLEKEGYSFSWSEAPETMPASDITITGEWSINSYLVTYIIDGEVYATDSVVYGATITLPEVPEKENSTFEWEEAPTTMPASDVTIYGNYVSGIGGITVSGKADVYTLNGMLYKRDVDLNKLNIELPKGIYIINDKKFIVR